LEEEEEEEDKEEDSSVCDEIGTGASSYTGARGGAVVSSSDEVVDESRVVSTEEIVSVPTLFGRRSEVVSVSSDMFYLKTKTASSLKIKFEPLKK
jgi:hypothetical protein